MSSLRGHTLIELMTCIILLVVMMGVVVPSALTLDAHGKQAGERADDLQTAVSVADRLAREIRTADRLVRGSRDGQVLTSRTSLVLRRGGEELAVSLESRGQRFGSWVILTRYPAGSAPPKQVLLGIVGGLGFRFDARRVSEARAVAFDVVLPERAESAPQRVLSARAVVGGVR